MLVLGIDIGTSSLRTALFARSGERIRMTTAQRSYRLLTDRSGRAELAPSTLLTSLTGCVGRTLALAATESRLRRQPIAAVGTSCFWHSLLGVDAGGQPLTSVLTWADSRCSEDAQRLRRRHDERLVHARTGCMLRSSYWPAKLVWLARTRPVIARRVRRWVSPVEWLYEHLCGEGRSAHGMATGSGLYDPQSLAWDPASLLMSGITEDHLNPIGDHPLRLLPAWRRRWPRLADARWYPAIGDGAANNLGAGATGPGDAAINVGTSAAIRVVRQRGRARAPFGLFCYRIDAQRFVIGGAISNAGSLMAWCQATLRLPTARAVEAALAAELPPEADPVVLPSWLGERAPSWREDLQGAIIGITQSTDALSLLRGILTASYQRLAAVLATIPARRRLTLILGGGILHSPASVQRLADVLEAPLRRTREPELSLRGAAVLAWERLGVTIATPRATATVAPRPHLSRRYAQHRRRMAAYEARLFPLVPPRVAPGIRGTPP